MTKLCLEMLHLQDYLTVIYNVCLLSSQLHAVAVLCVYDCITKPWQNETHQIPNADVMFQLLFGIMDVRGEKMLSAQQPKHIVSYKKEKKKKVESQVEKEKRLFFHCGRCRHRVDLQPTPNYSQNTELPNPSYVSLVLDHELPFCKIWNVVG